MYVDKRRPNAEKNEGQAGGAKRDNMNEPALGNRKLELVSSLMAQYLL